MYLFIIGQDYRCDDHYSIPSSNSTRYVGDNFGVYALLTFVGLPFDLTVFNYTPDHDVFEVSKSDFETCRINSPISTHDYDDEKGQTVILLSQPGWRYFVCGRSNHCTQGLKLSIQVLNQPNNTSSDDIKDEPEDHEPIPATGGGSNGSGIQGDIPKHGPHSSDGYSNFNAVTTGRCLLHLSIFMMGIMCIFCFPECWRLQMAGV